MLINAYSTRRVSGKFKTTAKSKSQILMDKSFEKMAKVLAHRNKYYKTERKLQLDPNKHFSQAMGIEDKIYGFGWKNGEYQRCHHPDHNFLKNPNDPRDKTVKHKTFVPLENHYKRRKVNPEQMRCTIEVVVHPLDFVRNIKAMLLKLEFRSSCFDYSKYTYLLAENIRRREDVPTIVKVDVADVEMYIRFNITSRQLPKVTRYDQYNFSNEYFAKTYEVIKRKRETDPTMARILASMHKPDLYTRHRELNKKNAKLVKKTLKEKNSKKVNNSSERLLSEDEKTEIPQLNFSEFSVNDDLDASHENKQSPIKEKYFTGKRKKERSLYLKSKKRKAVNRDKNKRRLYRKQKLYKRKGIPKPLPPNETFFSSPKLPWKICGIAAEILPKEKHGEAYFDYDIVKKLWEKQPLRKCKIQQAHREPKKMHTYSIVGWKRVRKRKLKTTLKNLKSKAHKIKKERKLKRNKKVNISRKNKQINKGRKRSEKRKFSTSKKDRKLHRNDKTNNNTKKSKPVRRTKLSQSKSEDDSKSKNRPKESENLMPGELPIDKILQWRRSKGLDKPRRKERMLLQYEKEPILEKRTVHSSIPRYMMDCSLA